MRNHEWLVEQVQAFERLRGRNVLHWSAIEMALAEDPVSAEHVWQHDSVPMLQLNLLDAVLDNGTAAVRTSQNDDLWSLSCALGARTGLTTFEPSSIFRARLLRELPVGNINDISVVLNGENVALVEIVVEGHCISLRAGEVYEQKNGNFSITNMDECILVQVGGKRPIHHPTGPAQKAAQGAQFRR
jgi:hypothetical protein